MLRLLHGKLLQAPIAPAAHTEIEQVEAAVSEPVVVALVLVLGEDILLPVLA